MSKTILFYIGAMVKGGANRVMAVLTDYFAEAGYRVILLNDILPDPKVAEYAVNRKVKRLYLSDSVEKPEKSNLKRVLRLRRILREETPDIVISFMGPPNLRTLVAGFGFPCKKIVSVRNDPYREYGNSILKKWLTGCLFRLSDGCVFQTREAADYFPKAVRKKSAVIRNPVAEEFFRAEPVKVPRHIVSVGRLVAQKNQKLLIGAFARIADRFPEENLIIYGEGKLRPELEDQIRLSGLSGRVFLPGLQSDVPARLREAKCFVLSSDYEGLPNALMEAMAVGLPVIATDCPCGGPGELLGDGCGLLVPCGDEKAMADAMERLLSDEEKRRSCALAAKKAALTFTTGNILRQWETFLTQKRR